MDKTGWNTEKELNKMGNYVYKYVYKDEIIYIGKNDTDLTSRLNRHGRPGDNIPEEGWNEINNSDIYYCELANRIMSDVVESELIRRYKPRYNKAKVSEWGGLDFVEPKWIKYNKELLSKYSAKFIEEYNRFDIMEEIDDEYLRAVRIINGGKEVAENEIKLLQNEVTSLKREIRYLEDIRKDNFVMKKIRDERRYSYEEMIMFYQYLDCDSNVKFSSTALDPKGNTLCHIEFWCENNTVQHKVTYYDDENRKYKEEGGGVCRETYLGKVEYICGNYHSRYGLIAETNNHQYIQHVLGLAKYKCLTLDKEKTVEHINRLIGIDMHSGMNIPYEEFINNLDYYRENYWNYEFVMHNDNDEYYGFESFTLNDIHFYKNLINVQEEKRITYNRKSEYIWCSNVRQLDEYKEFKFNITYRLKHDIDYYYEELEYIDCKMRELEMTNTSLFITRYRYNDVDI